jgi:hypothetical protein
VEGVKRKRCGVNTLWRNERGGGEPEVGFVVGSQRPLLGVSAGEREGERVRRVISAHPANTHTDPFTAHTLGLRDGRTRPNVQ